MSEIRLDQLPPIDIIEQKTPEEILLEIGKENTSAASPEGRVYRSAALYGSYRMMQEDSNAKSLLLAFATGENLDRIGETYYRNSDGSTIKRKDGESDDDYRMALHESPEGLTSAGTLKSYDFHASRSHPLLNSQLVRSHSPEPMVMDVWFISDDDNAADIERSIDLHLKPFVPSGDMYKAKRSTHVEVSVTAKVICEKGVGASIIKDEGLKALNDYLSKASVIGGVISDAWIKDCLILPGVVDVVMDDFKTIRCDMGTHPKVTSINISYEVTL